MPSETCSRVPSKLTAPSTGTSAPDPAIARGPETETARDAPARLSRSVTGRRNGDVGAMRRSTETANVGRTVRHGQKDAAILPVDLLFQGAVRIWSGNGTAGIARSGAGAGA